METEREEGYYLVRFNEYTSNGGWEPVLLNWDESYTFLERVGFGSIEWGPRIYPPDHIPTNTTEPFDYDERHIPDPV